MRLIDSHAHLDFEEFHADFNEVLKRAKKADVKKIVNIGADLERSRAGIIIAENNSDIFATVGVHPEYAAKINFETIHEDLMELAKSSDKVVAIGETGLDYYNSQGADLAGNPRGGVALSPEAISAQKKLLLVQIEIAKHLSLPLVIHIRNGEDESAAEDAYEILKNSDGAKGVIHCFAIGKQWAKRFSDLGFYIGFTGILTYKNAEEIREAAKTVPVSQILIETDCPFLAPQKYRGKRNEPSYVIEVLEKLAEVRGMGVAELSEIIFLNTIKLFDL